MPSTPVRAQLGVIGLGVMGRGLAVNAAGHGIDVVAWDLSPAAADALVQSHAGVRAAATLADLAAALARPRTVLLMVPAGAAVDEVLAALRPVLERGDVVVDGGNSHFEDTERRAADLAAAGLQFVGMGVSGGEEGALRGASLMPGGSPEAFAALRPILEPIAARTEAGPCVVHCGPGGAGHFVKMVHNGIEYADMQQLAEAYDVLRRVLGMPAAQVAAVMEEWSKGPLESFLVELSAKIFTVMDSGARRALVDVVSDRAGAKGTGAWTVRAALDVGVPVPSITAAVEARTVSSLDLRARATGAIAGPPEAFDGEDRALLIGDLEQALIAARIVAHAQGFSLLSRASAARGWDVPLAGVARAWRAGCIIRSRLMADVQAAFARDPDLPSLLLDPAVGATAQSAQHGWRRAVQAAVAHGIPVPAMSAGLAYFDAIRSARLPQSLTQAQRDAFGAHGIERIDHPELGRHHERWT